MRGSDFIAVVLATEQLFFILELFLTSLFKSLETNCFISLIDGGSNPFD